MMLSPPTASPAASGSVVASGGTEPPPGSLVGTRAEGAVRSLVHASRASSTVETAQSERRNRRQGIASRSAASAQASRARRSGLAPRARRGRDRLAVRARPERDREFGFVHGLDRQTRSARRRFRRARPPA